MDSRQGLPALNHLLQHTLRSLCTDSQWVYAVFWRILPRNYPPPQWDTEGGVMDRSKGNKRNWILVWEDGFCNFSACAGAAKDARGGSHFFGAQQHRGSDDESEAMNPELFFKMSHEVYNYGEGLMGKVAADNSHKWVYREPMEHEISFISPWHGSLDPHPRTWEAQFKSGIQTIAVVAVQEGVLQLGSTKKIMEDLNFVLHMQRKFNYLQSIPGVFVPHPASSAGGAGVRKRNGEGSPPADRGHWMAATEYERLTAAGGHLTARSIDQFLSPRLGPDPWRPATDTSILGVKRPPDGEPMTSLNFKDYNAYMNGSGNGSVGFECRPECPSPPKALNTGQSSPQGSASPTIPNLLPSMSSLQALLSKLPSVTPMEGDQSKVASSSSPPRSNGFEVGGLGSGSNNFSSNRPPIGRSSGKVVKEAAAVLDVQQGLDCLQGSSTGTAGSPPQQSGSDVMSGGEAPEESGSGTPQQQDGGTSSSISQQQQPTFLDTFANLEDFGLPLENVNDSYNSFLNEICS